jgi:hypothetical protein
MSAPRTYTMTPEELERSEEARAHRAAWVEAHLANMPRKVEAADSRPAAPDSQEWEVNSEWPV